MKNILFLFLVCFCLPGNAQEITTYKEFLNIIDDGKLFKFVTHLHKCNAKGEKLPFHIITYGSLNTIFALLDENHISTSALHISNINGKPSYELIRYIISSDNKATVHIYAVNPQKVVSIQPTKTLECTLGEGIFIHAY